MIRCAMDISIPENDKCDICCIHCSDKNCEYRCVGVDELKTEDKIEKYCINAYSMGG